MKAVFASPYAVVWRADSLMQVATGRAKRSENSAWNHRSEYLIDHERPQQSARFRKETRLSPFRTPRQAQ